MSRYESMIPYDISSNYIKYQGYIGFNILWKRKGIFHHIMHLEQIL